MNNNDFILLAKRQVARHENAREDIQVNIDRDDVFVVWMSKTLQNSKCLMSAPHKGAYYYEFTLNGDKEEIYMDVYKKVENIVLDARGQAVTFSNKSGSLRYMD